MQLCAAELFGISDKSYPYVLITDPVQAPVFWHQRAFGFRVHNSAAVRINARGIRFIPASHTVLVDMLENLESGSQKVPALVSSQKLVMNAMNLHNDDDGNDEELKLQSDATDMAKWRHILCQPARDCLCSLVSKDEKKQKSSRFLPNAPEPVYVSRHPLLEVLPLDVARMVSTGASCPESATGRVIVLQSPSPKIDISLCNIIGVGSDYLYVASTSKLYMLLDPVGDIVLLLISLLVVYLMVIMGHNLQVVLGAAPASPGMDAKKNIMNKKGQWTVICMLILVAVTCFPTPSMNVLNAYVTWEDKLAFFCLLAHVIYYCIRIEVNVWFGNGRRANPVNPMIAAIFLAVQRVYGSVENPYSLVLFFVMLTWALHKVSMLVHRVSGGKVHEDAVEAVILRSMDALVDCILLSMLLYSGAVGQMQMESTIAASNVLQGILAAMTLNRAVLPLHIAQRNKQQS